MVHFHRFQNKPYKLQQLHVRFRQGGPLVWDKSNVWQSLDDKWVSGRFRKSVNYERSKLFPKSRKAKHRRKFWSHKYMRPSGASF